MNTPERYTERYYPDIIDDQEIAELHDHLWRRAVEIFLTLQIMGNTTGELPTPKALAWRLRVPVNELQKDVEKLLEAGIIVLEAGKYTFKDFYVWKPEADRYAYEEKYSS